MRKKELLSCFFKQSPEFYFSLGPANFVAGPGNLELMLMYITVWTHQFRWEGQFWSALYFRVSGAYFRKWPSNLKDLNCHLSCCLSGRCILTKYPQYEKNLLKVHAVCLAGGCTDSLGSARTALRLRKTGAAIRITIAF